MQPAKYCSLFCGIVPSQPSQTSLRRLQDVLKSSRRLMTKQYVLTTSGKRCLIYVVLKTSNLLCLEDVWFTTSSGRLIYDVLEMSNLHSLENDWFTTCWRCLIYDVLKSLIYDVLKTSLKRRLCSNVYTTSEEIIFSYFALSEIFKKF